MRRMPAALRIRQVDLFPLAIPMRLRFEHAAAARSVADPIVVRLTAAAPYANLAGYGETLARAYVTGETTASVLHDLTTHLLRRLDEFAPQTFPEALEFIESLPLLAGDRVITAARAALELALLDLAGRAFRRRAADVAGWLGLPGFGPPGCLRRARYSGVVVGRTRGKLQAFLTAQRCYGLRDFKIKVAVPDWEERLDWAAATMRSALAAGRVTLRADANGGWSVTDAIAAAPVLDRCGVTAVEQPLADALDEQLPDLRARLGCDLIADESLVTPDDAHRLIAANAFQVFNIRIAKNGGLLPALRLARVALGAGLDVQLGCLVGETSILAAAGLAFLEVCPQVRFVEGAFGRWMLRDDVLRKSVQFGRGGRIAPRRDFGLGLAVDDEALARLSGEQARSLPR